MRPINKIKITIIVAVIMSITLLFPQTVVYTTDNHEIQLFENPHEQIIQLSGDVSGSQLSDSLASVSAVELVKGFGVHSSLFLLAKDASADWATIKGEIQNRVPALRWLPAYYSDAAFGEGSEYLISDRISVKFTQGTSDSVINQFAAEFGLQLVKGNASTRRCVFKMDATNTLDPLELAMTIDSDSRTIWGQIVHFTPIVLFNDPHYPAQWHLNNTGQSGGTAGYDINAEPAWDITTGDSAIVVAVLDAGVEAHEDFEDWQLLDGYTIGIEPGEEGCCGRPDDNNPNDPFHDKHGQPVAGLVTAHHNTIGVRGVGANFKILPVNISFMVKIHLGLSSSPSEGIIGPTVTRDCPSVSIP